MRKFLIALVAVVSVGSLSSCALLPLLISDDQRADARMGQIVAAVNADDADALKGLLSARAVVNASNLEERLERFLSSFPEGEITWERNGLDSSSKAEDGKKSKVLWCYYDVYVDEKFYWVFFAYFTENTRDPENVGLYAVGVTPRDESGQIDPSFIEWENSFDIDGGGIPGIYMPGP